MEQPAVPCSLPTELLDREWPEQEEPCIQACGFFRCGTTQDGRDLALPKPSANLARPSSVSLARKAKLAPTDTTVQAEPVIRQPAACSRVRDRTASLQDTLCGRWCGQDCAHQVQKATLLLTRPTFGRPPAHGGICDPEGLDTLRPEEAYDACTAIMWARPCDFPSLPPDAKVDDMADSNRQTSRPKFWWRDADEEEGLDQLVRQVHMPQETMNLWQPDTPRAPLPLDSPLHSPQSDQSHLIAPSSPPVQTPTLPTPTSHYSLNSILHKPGTRSHSPSVNQHVTFTLAQESKPPRPVSPFGKKAKAKAAPKHRSDSGVLWHLIPGS